MTSDVSAPPMLLNICNMSKSYKDYGSELRRVASWLLPVPMKQETTILHDINIQLKSGEAVGLVGENGAGKSTLLKLIVGTLKPSTGSIQVNGSISAILELGMGFNNDLTGRQNAAHSAALMGHTPDQIRAALPDIEAFAEIGDYFDQPMRLYSSGMQMRVAFAVATAFRPDLLIIDEALSVGDAYFQHKSFNRIRDIQAQGTALLIVSHDKEAILRLCDRVVLLDGGTVLQDGVPSTVMDYYNAVITDRDSPVTVSELPSGEKQTSSGNGAAQVTRVQLQQLDGKSARTLYVGQRAILMVDISVFEDLPELVVGYSIKDRLGHTLFGTNTFHTKQMLTEVKKGQTIQACLAFDVNLGAGNYNLSLALHSADTHLEHNYHWLDYALIFEVVNIEHPHFIGTNFLNTAITQHVCSEQINAKPLDKEKLEHD